MAEKVSNSEKPKQVIVHRLIRQKNACLQGYMYIDKLLYIVKVL